MSEAPNKIWTRCPVCRSKYQVGAEAAGHHARCKKCNTRFRVQEYSTHPTEDDILRWLNEGSEESETIPHPRIISGTQRRDPPMAMQVAARSATVVHNVIARAS